MLNDKRMRLIKSDNEINYYLFTPSVFSLYYKDSKQVRREEPSHRYTVSHQLHMLWYALHGGGYRILYLEKDHEILSYVIFVRANNQIISGCEKDDYYTIFLWTYPEFRGRGLATMMANAMLHDLCLPYNHFYKTISKDNYASMKVAEKSGFFVKCESEKTGLLHTIHFTDHVTQLLYCYQNEKRQG